MESATSWEVANSFQDERSFVPLCERHRTMTWFTLVVSSFMAVRTGS